MFSQFYQMDLFGKPVAFNFNGKNKSRSPVGAWFTLAFFGFVCWSIYEVSQDLIYRRNPKTIMSEYFQENPAPMVISPETFNFAFGLEEPITTAHFIDESIYTVQAVRIQGKRIIKEDGTLEFEIVNTVLNTERCTKEHFGSLGPKFENIQLELLYCLQKNQEIPEVQIQGAYESPVFEFIKIFINQCNNMTSKVPCAPKEIIDQQLSEFFATYFKNVAIEPRNYTNPNSGYRDSFYTQISNTYSKEITLWLSHIGITSDFGWLTKEARDDNYIRLERTQEYLNMKPLPDQVMTFIIRVGKMGTHYERSYIKIQDVIAQVNGFASTGLMIGFIILGPYSNIKFYERLINELFDVKKVKKASKATSKSQSKKRKNSKKFVEGEKARNSPKQEEALSLEIHSLEKQFLRVGSPSAIHSQRPSLTKLSPSSPKCNDHGQSDISNIIQTETENFGKNILTKPGNTDQEHSTRNSIPCPLQNLNERYCSSQTLKNGKFINLDMQSNENDDKHRREKETRKLNSNFQNKSPFFSLRLFQEKPNQTGQLQMKAGEEFKIQAPEDIEFAFEGVAVDKQEKVKRKSKEFFETPNSDDDPDKIPAKVCWKEANNVPYHLKVKVPKRVEENTEQKLDEKELLKRAESLPSQLTQDLGQLDISFLEYIMSYVWRTKYIKEKFGLLKEGIRRIEERMNLFNLLKKLREVDKLKLLLLESDELVLFDTLPNPELTQISKTQAPSKRRSFSHIQLKDTRFIAEKRKYDIVKGSYISLKKKAKPTMIDEKLLEVYDDIIDS